MTRLCLSFGSNRLFPPSVALNYVPLHIFDTTGYDFMHITLLPALLHDSSFLVTYFEYLAALTRQIMDICCLLCCGDLHVS